MSSMKVISNPHGCGLENKGPFSQAVFHVLSPKNNVQMFMATHMRCHTDRSWFFMMHTQRLRDGCGVFNDQEPFGRRMTGKQNLWRPIVYGLWSRPRRVERNKPSWMRWVTFNWLSWSEWLCTPSTHLTVLHHSSQVYSSKRMCQKRTII